MRDIIIYLCVDSVCVHACVLIYYIHDEYVITIKLW